MKHIQSRSEGEPAHPRLRPRSASAWKWGLFLFGALPVGWVVVHFAMEPPWRRTPVFVSGWLPEPPPPSPEESAAAFVAAQERAAGFFSHHSHDCAGALSNVRFFFDGLVSQGGVPREALRELPPERRVEVRGRVLAAWEKALTAAAECRTSATEARSFIVEHRDSMKLALSE